MLGIDLQPPRQIGRLAEQLLVEPVAPAPDPLREQQTRRDRVHEQPDALMGSMDDPCAREDAEEDSAPDAEPALPDGERRPPRVEVVDLVPAGDVVVEPRADDPGGDAPDRDAEDEIPVAAPLDPAVARQRDAGRDREQERDAVEVDRERADVDRAAVRRGNRGKERHRTEDSARSARACRLEQDLQRQLGGTAVRQQLDCAVQVDVVPHGQLGRRGGAVARQLELLGPPGLDQVESRLGFPSLPQTSHCSIRTKRTSGSPLTG